MYLRLFFITALLFSLPATAAYKWTMPDGSVIFSDTPPHPDAEKITLPPTQTFTSPPTKKSSEQTPPEEKPLPPALYSSLQITLPENDQTIRDNTGSVSISITSDPPLIAQRNHKIIIELDGSTIITTTSPEAVLSNIDRGTHTLRAHIADKNGAILISSTESQFHLRRMSALH